MTGQFLEAFSSGNIEKLLHLAHDLPESEKRNLLDIVASWKNSRIVISPLSAAIIGKNFHVCKLLIEDGAPLVQTLKNQHNPLSIALQSDQSKIAEFIIDSGADVSKIEYDSSYPIFWAISNNHPSNLVEKIISAGFPADSIALKNLNLRPIHTAVKKNKLDVVLLLLKYSVDLNATTSQGETPLLIAIEQNLPEIVEVLVNHGADLNVNASITPLLLAIKKKNLKMVGKLLDLGASIELGWVDKISYSPLAFTIDFALDDVLIKFLLSRGASVFSKDELTGETPLHKVCDDVVDNEIKKDKSVRLVQVKVAKMLLDCGADIDAVSLGGGTPLYEAIFNENKEMCTFLIRQGAKLANVTPFIDTFGAPVTPFEHIVTCENLATPELIKLCLEQGSDYNYRNKFGLTMYHCAEKYNNEEMIKYFLQHGCPYNQEKHMPGKLTSHFWPRRNDKVTRLLTVQSNFILGIKKGITNTVLKSIEQGAEPKGCSLEIPSTLHYVASKGYNDLARLLLEKGVPVNRLNSKGVTALYLAVQGGHLKTCQVLLEFGACYCHRGSVDNKGIELLVKSHQDISKVFKKISKCFKLTKLGDSSVSKVVLDCGEVMLPVLMNCVNRQGLTLTGLSLRLGHSGLATDLMALRVEHLTVKD